MVTTPAIANAPRRVSYAPAGSVGPFSIPFPIYDLSGADLRVTLNGVRLTAGAGFTVSASTPVNDFYGQPNTWTDAVVVLTAPATGTLVIAGARAPRRAVQFQEGRGVPARDYNYDINVLTATLRELFDTIGSSDGLADAQLDGLYSVLNGLDSRVDTLELLSRDYNNGASTVAKQITDKVPLTIAFEGTSLTYGQDDRPATVNGQPTGTRDPINGATQRRSARTYPEALSTALQLMSPGQQFTIINRGYPGDTTEQGLSRWANATPTEVCFVEYGTNEQGGYGGNPLLSIAQFGQNLRAIVARRQAQGTAVYVVSPALVADPPSDRKIAPYRVAAREVAESMRVPFFDTVEQVGWLLGRQTTDLVHLLDYVYSEWGWHFAGAMLKGANRLSAVRMNLKFNAQDQAIYGGTAFAVAEAASGAVTMVNPGETVTIAGYFEDTCIPRITMMNLSAGVNRRLNIYYGGTADSGSNVPIITIGGNMPPTIRGGYDGHVLYRGWRTLFLRNDFAEAAYIETVEFRRADAGS